MRIAVYGTLRRGFGNYEWCLKDQEFLGITEILLPFKMVSLGGFPGLVPSDTKNSITIEVFKIDEEAFRSVDNLEGYPTFYNRKLIDTPFGQAWIYFLEDEGYVNLQQVESGDWYEFISNTYDEVLS